MSEWTHVTGAVRVDTYARSDAEAVYIAQTVANHLPRITGSEEDAHVYVNLERGFNMSSTDDEFGRRSNLGNDWVQGQRNMFDTQSKCVLTITGDLRDRSIGQTVRETARMLARLASRLDVDTCSVTVSGYDPCGGKIRNVTFGDAEWLRQIETTDFARRLTWNPYHPPIGEDYEEGGEIA